MEMYLQYQKQLYLIRGVLYRTTHFAVYELADLLDLNGPVCFIALTRENLIYRVGVHECSGENGLMECYGRAQIVTL